MNSGRPGNNSSQNPFDNFGGPSAGAGGSAGYQDTFANPNPSSASGQNDFGDLFNKDWLKGSGGPNNIQNIKKKMGTNLYAYNPVDLSSMPAAQ